MSVDVERLARKLQPLMPARVRHWFRIRATADPELKSLLDKQIVALAYGHLGDFREKLLLSLPPPERSKGEINLGTVLYEIPKWPLGISRGELLQNLAILGRSGSGKTNLLFHILQQLDDKRLPFIMFDWKRTGRALLPTLRNHARVYTPGRGRAPLRFNLFASPPGMEIGVYVQLLVDTVAEAFTLGEGARSVLLKAILQCVQRAGTATVERVIEVVDGLDLRHREHGWRASALRALRSLAMLQIEGSDDQADAVQVLMGGSTIIELDGLSHGGKRFLVPMISLWVYQTLLATGKRESLSLTLAIDEAHHVLYGQARAHETVIEMLLRQCREIGIGTIVLDQNPHLLSAAALGNVFATVCLNQKEPKDVNKAASLSSLDDDGKNWLSRLPVGHAVVRLADRWTHPVLVQVPLANVDKASVSGAFLADANQIPGPGSGEILGDVGQLAGVPRNPASDMVLNDEGMRLLDDVLRNPDSGVRERYARLGLPPSSGHRLKQRLLGAGWLESVVVPHGRTRKVLLRWAAAAARRLHAETPPASASRSRVHDYWKQFYADMLRALGYEVTIEGSRNGSGRGDVIAQKRAQRVVVEIETGRSDVVFNVRRDLAAGFDRICVVATTADALRKIAIQLGQASLLISRRVLLVTAPEQLHLSS